MATAASDSDCSVCAHLATLPDAEILWRDDYWLATGLLDVPGWIAVSTRRHAEGVWSLDEAEAASLGPALRDIAAALRTVTQAERIHLAAQGESAPHFHYIIMPRLAGATPVFDRADLIRRAGEDADAARAGEVNGRVRDLLEHAGPGDRAAA